MTSPAGMMISNNGTETVMLHIFQNYKGRHFTAKAVRQCKLKGFLCLRTREGTESEMYKMGAVRV
eukprot:3981451-Amphidinium_carterae.1